MTCYHPNTAHYAGLNTNGNKLIKFGLPEKSGQEGLLLPCGQCIGCRLDRSIMWAARCMHEKQMHLDAQFITLTYAIEPQYGSLNPPDFVNFMKRYRLSLNRDIPEFLDKEKLIKNPDFTILRFFHGAEYGDNLKRPHHHACIFGHDFEDKEIFSECEGIITYYSPTLENLWGHGFATTSDVTLNSAAYVARYCMQKITAHDQSEDKYHEHYQTTCPYTGEITIKIPEYGTMSRNPGLGKDWYDRYHSDIFPHDTCIINGRQVRTPRYYENLLRSSDLPLFEEIKSKRKTKALASLSDHTPARLRTREKVTQLNLKANQLRKIHNDS